MIKSRNTLNLKFTTLKLMLLFVVIFLVAMTAFLVRGYYVNGILRSDIHIYNKNIRELQLMQQDLILNARNNISVFLQDNPDVLVSYNNSCNELENLITDQLLFIAKKDDSIHNNLLASIEHNKSLFEEIVMTIREKGSPETGLLKEWIRLSDSLVNIADSIPGTGVSVKVHKARTLEKEYLLTCKPEIFAKLTIVLTDLLHNNPDQPEQREMDYYNRLSNNINEYIKSGNRLIKLDSRLGLSSDAGLLSDIKQSNMELSHAAIMLSSFVDNNLNKRKALNGIIIILILLASLILLLWRVNTIQKAIKESLQQLLHATGKLRKGLFPEKIKLSESSGDFGRIATDLNHTIDGLKEKAEFAGELSRGNKQKNLNSLGESDKLAIYMSKLKEYYIKNLEEQEIYTRENEVRRFITEGLAKFNEIIRINSNNLDHLNNELIRELVKYLDSVQGGIFIIDEKNADELKLVASFAYNRKKYMQKTLIIGEGLVGTCAVEKKTIHLTEVPADYIEITSVLGDAPPDNLLLVPMIEEEQILGVIEIASLKKFDKHQIDLLEQVAHSIASSINFTRNNAKTQELLEKTQKQAAEMAEQEEEMRQNMEELQATQEESSRREEELKGVLNAVRNTLYIIEYDIAGTIINANSKFLKLLDVKHDDIKGKSHSDLTEGMPPEKFKTSVLSKVIEGENVTIEGLYISGKKQIKLREHFSPVKSKTGTVSGMINMAINMND